VWALDLDPKNVTDWPAVNALLATLPPTWTQRTGRGGQHWVFALPDDFIPNNSSKRLPAGLDVRGARAGEVSGGQIVLAPSVSGVGAYEVLHGGAVLAGSATLLDLVRPAPPRERPDRPAAGPGDRGERVAGRGLRGRRDQRRAAHDLIGLRPSARAMPPRSRDGPPDASSWPTPGWPTAQTGARAWWAAAAAHPDRIGDRPDRALLIGLGLGRNGTVGDRPADLSGVGGPSGWQNVGGEGIPFFAAPGAAPGLGQAGSGSGGQQGVTDARDSVTAQVMGVTDPVETMLAQLLSVEQLKTMPPPQPLVNGMLDLDTTAWLIGASGSYKSFVALDLAAHVGTGPKLARSRRAPG
jgi:hypothetical protein